MNAAPEYVHLEAGAINRDRQRLAQTDAEIPRMEQQLSELQAALADVTERLGKARESRALLQESNPLRVESLRLLCEAHGWDLPQPPPDAPARQAHDELTATLNGTARKETPRG